VKLILSRPQASSRVAEHANNCQGVLSAA
jgi:hypothetical protein